ncbi:MAG TPA: hypothetical protein DDX14_10240, partial [Cyanobacteria bacterium UBA9579]|nr:hypothetical protein [Cyanobacteria bacterium UBA9579]
MINQLGTNPFDRLNQIKEEAQLKSQISQLMIQLKSAQTKEAKVQISNQLQNLAQSSDKSLVQLGGDISSIFAQQAKPALAATNTNAVNATNADQTAAPATNTAVAAEEGASAFEQKAQQDNVTALKGLDAGAKTILEQAAESTNNDEKQFESIAQKLNSSGYQATVVESDHVNEADTTLAGQKTKYLEITDKNGKTTRIWDSNGNGTLEAADFNTNTYLKEFANDLKAAKFAVAPTADTAATANAKNENVATNNNEALQKLEAGNKAGGGNNANNAAAAPTANKVADPNAAAPT